jgi:hypothetical protein
MSFRRTCSIEGCESDFYAKGWCNKHWTRWRKHGDPLDAVPVGHRRTAKKLSMSEADLAWLAGLLEGEGSFYASGSRAKNGVMYRYPQIKVSMTDRDVIERVAQMFGIKVSVNSREKRREAKQIYSAQINGSRAMELMQQLLPWMGKRRSQKIKELLNTQHGRVE